MCIHYIYLYVYTKKCTHYIYTSTLSIQANHYIFAGRISEISWNVDGRRNQNMEGILRSKMFISEDASTYDFNM